MKPNNFLSAQKYLESLIPSEKRHVLGLERIRALLKLMGNPQDSYPTVHVGGTAGKGSTSTIIAGILQQAGYKTGLHVSPHLEDIREREMVDGHIMTKANFVRLVNYIRPYVEQTESQYPYGVPTYFEALLALTFKHFKDMRVDVAVIEVGLGGRLDGTNVITPKVAVLTNVGLDHTEILGKTVEKIASDKVGIFKEGIDVVSGVTQPTVIKIVEDAARRLNCSLDLLGWQFAYTTRRSEAAESVFDLKLGDGTYTNLKMSVLGEHQAANASLAIDAALKLNRHGFKISEKDVRSALKSVKIPGRFEIVRKRPTVILDGAHNQMKTDALASTLKEYCHNRRVNFVFAVKKDKDAAGMLRTLSKMAGKFYFTKFDSVTDFGDRMSHDPRDLAHMTDCKHEVLEDPYAAYRKALSETGRDGVVCVTGSLYLVGNLRSRIGASNKNL